MNQSKLVLGSSSPYRAELLARLGIPFSQESPDVDERAFDGDFAAMGAGEFALTLARAKAEALAAAGGERYLLCADQVGVHPGGDLLVKPGTEERCVEQLLGMAGGTHELINGVVLLEERSGRIWSHTDRQELTMRAFGRAEAEAYVREFQPLDCAGGYRIEDAGIRLFERIRSDDYTGIIGLPLLATARLLRQAGLLVP